MNSGQLASAVSKVVAAAAMFSSIHTGAFAATLVVTNTADTGPGSLREAITAANTDPSADQILFADTAFGTITLTTALPTITQPLEILGPGPTLLTIDGADVARPFEIAAGVTATVARLTVANGYVVGGPGGGIRNDGALTLERVVLSGNNAPGTGTFGGGVYSTGTLLVTNSTLTGNHVSDGFGGGGGIASSGHLIVINSTFVSNTGCLGGAISNYGSAQVINSTISDNSASCSGGAIFSAGISTELSNTTIASNTASLAGGIYSFSGTTTINDSLLVSNVNANCFGAGLTATGANLATDNTCGTTAVPPSDINLGPLADNGGPTQTRALLPGSVAIDAAADCTDLGGNPLTQDQRGFARPVDGDGTNGAACDLGSYEFGAAAVEIPTLSFVGLLFLSVIMATIAVARIRRGPQVTA